MPFLSANGIPILIPGTTSHKRNVKGEMTEIRDYRLYFGPNDSAVFVYNNLPSGLKLRTQDPSDPGLVVIEVEVSQQGVLVTVPDVIPATEGLTWIAHVTYGPWTDLLNSPDDNPINQPARFYTECTREQRILVFDADGQPILNIVGDPFDPAPMRDATVMTLFVERNEDPGNVNYPNICQNWFDHINENDWNGFAARTLKVCPVNFPKPVPIQQTGTFYLPMVYAFEYKPEGWDIALPEVGLREFDTSKQSTGSYSYEKPDGSSIEVTTYPLKDVLIDGVPCREAVFLNLQGAYIQPPISETDFVVRPRKAYPTLDFSELGMDQLFSYGGRIPTGSNPSGGD